MRPRLVRSRQRLLFFFLGGLAAACSSQATPAYQGEPLAVVRGVATGSASTSGVDALLMFSKGGGQLLGVVGRGPVRSEFPQRFTLDVLEPPPSEVQFETVGEESRLSFAYIVAVPTGVEPRTPEEAADILLGAVDSYVVVYNDRPIREGSPLSHAFGATLDVGYHLLMVRPYTDDERNARASCHDQAAAGTRPETDCATFKMHVELAAEGFAKDVELRLGPNARDALPDLS